LGKQVKEFVERNDYGIKIEYSFDGSKLLGTGGAIKKIGKKLPPVFFVLYGDSYTDIDFKDVEDQYYASGKKGLMTIFKIENKYDKSNVVYKNGKIIFYSKINKLPEMNYIDYGVGILTKNIFDSYPARTAFDLACIYEDLSGNKELAAFKIFERFYEVGSYNGLEDLCRMLL
jgi:NDP-sugar pyrophosphorylase family protein